MPKAKIGDIQLYYEEYGHGHPLIMVLGLGQDIAT
jgi:3-oxoadipate enol-lactonase